MGDIDLRGKKIVLVSHCILNQNCVVEPLARAKGAFKFVTKLVDEGVGILQLPCPELRHYGLDRKPMDKFDYDTPIHRQMCKDMLRPVIREIEEYMLHNYEIIGIIGVEDSPNCDIKENRGIFMQELFKLLNDKNLQLKSCEVPLEYDESH
ncbi:MAG TPA: hypothetical protein PK083_02285 [Soehngenia sp.]|nr:hypothetical protein [Soehngenia sp.]HPP31273.1 hypothetical protein [Soehngenia sp.]